MIMTTTETINKLKPIIDSLARKNSWIVGKKSLVMAQVLLESGWLRSCPNNNCLGIKVPVSKINVWNNKQLLWTKEWNKSTGKYEDVQAWFMTYPSLEACIESGYIKVLSYPRYKDTRDSLDWWEATQWIKYNGYATSPRYTENLRNLILSNKLYEIDFRHNPEDRMTENFKYGESFSNVRIGYKTYYRIIENPALHDVNRGILVGHLQRVRSIIAKPLTVTPNGCWYRQPQYNAQVGGVANSQHLYGKAVDIYAPRGFTGYDLYKVFKEFTDIRRFGIAKTWIHVDIGEVKSGDEDVWYY